MVFAFIINFVSLLFTLYHASCVTTFIKVFCDDDDDDDDDDDVMMMMNELMPRTRDSCVTSDRHETLRT